MDYCLPKDQAAKFLAAIKDGTLNPEKLSGLSSEGRRKAFGEVLGEDHAEPVNALFESKMLLADQKRGLVTWAKKLSGISEARRQDILDRINKISAVLNPADEKAFMADLAKAKLGIAVTADEAKAIYALAQKANGARDIMRQDMSNVQNRIAYGRAQMAMTDYLNSVKPNGRTLSDKLVDAANVPKSMLTSILHFSAPFVQGWGMISTQRSWEAFGQMFRYFANEENYKNLNAYIITHPDYILARDGKLGLTYLGDKLTLREEAIQSSLVERANQYLTDKADVPNLVRASSRAFTGYLNYIRFNRFTDLLEAARMNGENVVKGAPVVRDLAKVVNDFTGRGALGKDDRFQAAVPALNAMFFSPRKISATINMFNPVRYLNPAISPTARRAAMRQLLGSIAATGAVIGLSKAMGADVGVDPTHPITTLISQDFAKIKIGNEKFDLTGGNAIYLRLLARIATGQELSSHGKLIELGQGYKPTTRADLILRYTRDKFSPIAGALADALYGTDPIGRPFSVTQEMRDKLVPITMGDFINVFENDPDRATAMIPSLAAIFGVQEETPLPDISKTGRDVWGEKYDNSVLDDPTIAQLQQHGITPRMADEKIRGVQLNEAQYDEFQQYTGRLSKQAVGRIINSQWFHDLPASRQADLLDKTIRQARDHARNIMLAHYPDIIRQANAAKRAKLNDNGYQ